MKRSIVAFMTAASVIAMSGCASAPRAEPPTVTLIQTSDVLDLRINVTGGVPLVYALVIENPFDYAVTLVSVELETAGQSGAYRMERVRHAFAREIPAGAKEEVELRAWIHPLQADTRGRIDNPVLVRGTARFETPRGVSRATFLSRAQ